MHVCLPVLTFVHMDLCKYMCVHKVVPSQHPIEVVMNQARAETLLAAGIEPEGPESLCCYAQESQRADEPFGLQAPAPLCPETEQPATGPGGKACLIQGHTPQSLPLFPDWVRERPSFPQGLLVVEERALHERWKHCLSWELFP